MDFQFSAEQEIFRRTIVEFAERYVSPRIDEMEQARQVPLDLMQQMAEHGIFGLRYPETYGGQGGDNVLFAILNEELGRCYLSAAARAMMQCLMGTDFIYRHGTEEQRKRLLVPAIRGEKFGTMCMTEPTGGTDLGAMLTTATRDGDEYVINGSKTWITAANVADFFTVAAKTDPEAGFRGVDLFLVERGTPGLEVGDRIDKLVAWGSGCYELHFKDVRVPAENLFGGKEGQGGALLRGMLNEIRVHTAALALGITRAAYEDSVEYANQRIAFGRPIVKFQAMKHKLAKMMVDIEAARLMIYYAAWLLDQGLPCNLQAATAKYHVTEAAIDATEDATRIFGAYGMSMEMAPQRYFRDARWFLYGAGTQTINLDIIASEIQKGR